jgi:predicted Zn-dependent protease
MKKTIYLLSISLLCCLSVSAQNQFKEAWKSFLKNDTENAKKTFKELANKPETANEANLSLSLLAEMEEANSEAFQYFQKFFTTAKNPEPYLFALWRSPAVNDSYGKVTPATLALMNRIANNKSFDGSLNAMAYSVIGKHYQILKKLSDADKAHAQIGSIDNWQITSTFENISTSGFDKSYPVLDQPQATAQFMGKKNISFGWRKVPYLKRDKWFDFTYYDSPYNAIIFAQSFVNAPSALNAQLRIGVSGSVKVWVNDKLVISEAEERNNDLDSYIASIKLNAGFNRVLVQIGESYAGRSNFLVRITDEKGYPVQGITSSNEYQAYQKEQSYEAKNIKPAAYTYFENLAKADTSNYLNQLLLAKLYLRDDIIFETRNILENLKAKFPESTYLNTLLITLHSKEDNRTGVETLQENIKTADPNSVYALKLRYAEYVNQEDYQKADEIVSQLEERLGENEEVVADKIQLAGKRNNQQQVVDLVERAYKTWPENSSFVYVKYIIEKDVKKNAQALNILKKFVAGTDNYEYAKFLANAYFNKGDIKAGTDIYLEEIKNEPVGIGIYDDLAENYYARQKYDKAEEFLLKAIEIAPYQSTYYKTLGLVLEAKKEDAKAEEAYKKCLALDPNNYDAIQQLRRLKKSKDVFDYFEQPDVATLIKNAPGLTEYPDDHSVILTEEVQAVVHENGGSEEKYFVVTKILTQKGLENLKEYAISYNADQSLSVEVAETIKPNGTKTPAEQSGNNLVFTNLEVGDVINIRYKLRNYNVGSLASHFWSTFYFTHGSPYVNSKYSLLINKNKKFNYKFSENTIEAKKTSVDEFDLYTWEAKNQVALVYEDKMPPLDDVANILYISTIPDWKFVANWYHNIATAKARSSYEIKTRINELFPAKTAISDLEKVRRIYDDITQNIAYSSVSFRQSGIVPQNPAKVLNTRIGDCKDVSTLFVAMCKEVGIDAELVLVKTRDYGQNTLLLPSIDFNHCIAKTSVKGKTYFIELTSGTLPFASFYNSDLSAPILEINTNTSNLTKLMPNNRVSNHVSYVNDIAIKDSDMMITETNFCTGSYASQIRQTYKDLSAKDQLKKMKEQISYQYPDNEAISLTFTNLDPKFAVSDTLKATSSYNLLKICKPVAGMSIFSLPWTTAIPASSLTVTDPRHFGIDLTQLFSGDINDEQINLTLPVGKKLIEPVKPLTIDNEYFTYKLTSAPSGNKIVINRELIFKKDFVAKEKVSEFNALYKQVTESDHQQLAIK